VQITMELLLDCHMQRLTLRVCIEWQLQWPALRQAQV